MIRNPEIAHEQPTPHAFSASRLTARHFWMPSQGHLTGMNDMVNIHNLLLEEIVMKSVWITFVILSFMMIGCGPQTRIQKTYIHVEQAKTGAVDVFTSFDEVGASYKKVAELKVIEQRAPDKKTTDAMIESLKTKARKLGADGIVIVKEGKFIERVSDGFGGAAIFYNHVIICTAIVYG
jgi:hypothetical protein